jgi:hypothetical protein
LFFVFGGLFLLYGEMEQLHGWTAIILIAVTYVCLFLVAANEVRKKRRAKLAAAAASFPPPPPLAPPQPPTLYVAAGVGEERSA